MAFTTGYGVEIVGTTFLERLDAAQTLSLMQLTLSAVAQETYERTAERLKMIDFKRSTGRIHQALKWASGEGWAAVYMDPVIAPHAKYVEGGVRPHTMRYLLKATKPIPVGVGNVTLFRWATEKWMDRPHPLVDPVSGLVFMTKGWRHPGYPGHFFMREGVKEAIEIAQEKTRAFVFRLFSVEGEG